MCFWVNWEKKYEEIVVRDLIHLRYRSIQTCNHEIWFKAIDKLADEMRPNNDNIYKKYYKILDRAREGY